jgi:hypothetical protein
MVGSAEPQAATVMTINIEMMVRNFFFIRFSVVPFLPQRLKTFVHGKGRIHLWINPTHLRFDYERDEHPLSAQRELRPPEGHTALAYGASVGTM